MVERFPSNLKRAIRTSTQTLMSSYFSFLPLTIQTDYGESVKMLLNLYTIGANLFSFVR